MKIGIYGGSFNPVHNGHVHLAQQAKSCLGLDQVLLIPGATPPHKTAKDLVSGAHRKHMLSLAVEDEDGMEVSDIELKRSGISYTVDTIHELLGNPGEYYLIMGSDMFRSFTSWYAFAEISMLVTLVVAPREEAELEDLMELKAEYHELGIRSIILPVEPLVVSSTDIRQNTDSEFLHPNVKTYIQQNHLYDQKDYQYPYDIEGYKVHLHGLMDEKRYTHCINVADEARKLGELWGHDPDICYLAGLLHDVTKRIPYDDQEQYLYGITEWNDPVFQSQKQVWHGFSGAEYLKRELNFYHCEILNAVRFHSTGNGNMTLLEKIIYVADLTSPERDFPDVEEVRRLSRTDLDAATAYVLHFTLEKLIRKKRPLLLHTVLAYNSVL